MRVLTANGRVHGGTISNIIYLKEHLGTAQASKTGMFHQYGNGMPTYAAGIT